MDYVECTFYKQQNEIPLTCLNSEYGYNVYNDKMMHYCLDKKNIKCKWKKYHKQKIDVKGDKNDN